MRPLPLFGALVIACWLGLHAFRSFVFAAVWNLSDELPLHLKPMFALGTHTIGLVGAIIVLRWRRRTLMPLAILFAAVSAARQLFLASDAIGPYLALAAWPLWLWLMAALADEVSAHEAENLVAPALALAMALQLGMQSAFHGLDLPSVRHPLAAAVSALLALLLVLAVRRSESRMQRSNGSLVWLLVGPALFLELTLVGNAGRIAELGGLSVFTAVIVMQISLLVGVVIAERWASRLSLVVLGIAGVVALLWLPESPGAGALTVLIVQLVIIAGLHASAPTRIRLSAAAAFTVSGTALMILVFVFYNAYELPWLWLVALVPIALAGATVRSRGGWPAPRIVTAFAGACALATLYLLPPPAGPERDSGAVTVASYNVHQGFDDDGLPGMQRIAREIAFMNADLVALQETGRGWTLLGGNDLVGYLRWRFPQYQVGYVPHNGRLWGVTILSRLPVTTWSGGVFDAAPGDVRYGWAAATVQIGGGPLEFYSVHVTPDLAGPMGDARLSQARALAELVKRKERVVLAGDLNAEPHEPPIRLLRTALADLGEPARLQGQPTWPAGQPHQRLDYILGRGVTVTGGSVPRTPASDHLPVLVRLQTADTTAAQQAASNRSLQRWRPE